METAQEKEVELYVRQILAKEEVDIRRQTAEEIREYRRFMQQVVTTLGIVLSSVFVAGGVLFTFFFQQSIDDTRERIIREVDQQIIEYRINESFRDRLEKQIETLVQSKTVTDNINMQVKNSAQEQVRQEAEGIITAAVQEEVTKLKDIEIRELIDLAVAEGTRRDIDLEAEMKRLVSQQANQDTKQAIQDREMDRLQRQQKDLFNMIGTVEMRLLGSVGSSQGVSPSLPPLRPGLPPPPKPR